MIIAAHGIFLPDGQFLHNTGGSHSKNAILFCERYPELYELLDGQDEYPPDEFMIVAGCAITAGYGGKPCFKIAVDNNCSVLNQIKDEYKQENYEICESWNIQPEYNEILKSVIKKIESTENSRKKDRSKSMNLRGKSGFVINKTFYPNEGLGHEKNAMQVIQEHAWDWDGKISAQDYLVCLKGAIQIGSGTSFDVVLFGKDFFTQPQARSILKQYRLYGYKFYRI